MSTLDFLGLTPRESDSQEDNTADVVTVRDILLHFFSQELVYIILDLADYWAQVKSTRTQLLQVAARKPQTIVSLCYLVTPPILDGYRHKSETIRLKVTRVKFTTVDQGWAANWRVADTWDGYIWFETAIMRSNEAPDHALPDAWLWLARAIDATVKMDVAHGYDAVLEVKDAAHDGRWTVQQSFRPSGESRRRLVAWDADDTATPRAESELPREGAGDGVGFIAGLRPGDRIGVFASAKYPGYANFVKSVEVSVYYSLA
ncbi:hypothetical protein DFH07DRAFT_741078 [Mycena maculata]|uniref:Uncharacterized protein n=1 Tax=Mycena maculata TaxID=230809 RepID=A0AAD7NH73_9AGAR|nr:hypothetical protein DFH07DRAFT_741078 [Mycena maculata]